MRWTRLAWILFPTLAFAGACGGDDGGGGGGPPVEPKIETLAKAVCDLAFKCCARGEVDWFMGPWITGENCPARFVSHAELSPSAAIDLEPVLGIKLDVPNIAGLQNAVTAGRTVIDEVALQSCLNFLAAAPCNEPEPEVDGCVPPDPPPEKTPCDPRLIFIGQIALGGTCTSSTGSIECKPGLACRTDGGTGVFGQCVQVARVNEPCVTDSECDEDLYCSALDATCQAFRVEGETCVFADPDDPAPDPQTALIRCRQDLSCDPLTDTCVVACQRGASCETDEQCNEDLELKCIQKRCDLLRGAGLPCSSTSDCVEGLQCEPDPADPTSYVCSELAADGTVCDSHTFCASGFCDPVTFRCTAQLPPGSLCPTGLNQQCKQGRCVQENLTCTTNTDCPGSNKCDLLTQQCASYCIELLPDGAACLSDTECASEDCIAGFCRTPPLAPGQPCETAEQCDSDFCSYDDQRVCKELPLPLGDPCISSDQCESEVCFQTATTLESTCITGLDEGAECGKSGQPPCSPLKFFCDTDETTPVCVPLLETGEECESDIQCRGECTLQHSRKLCSPKAAPNAAVCDGL